MSGERDSESWVIVSTVQELLTALGVVLLPVRLAADPGAECAGRCVESLLLYIRDARPVALLLTENKRLLRIAFPITGRVLRHWDDDGGALRFAVTGCPTPFTLSGAPPDFGSAVLNASEKKTEVIVLDPLFEGRPVIVREWVRAPAIAPRRSAAVPEADPCNERFDLVFSRAAAIQEARANAIYRTIFAEDCRRPYREGIAFRFSYTFCYAVADLIARRLTAEGIEVGKAWVFSKRGRVMTIKTTSRKSCSQSWWYHAVAIVRSNAAGGGGYWVFDPILNLEKGVLSFTDWKARLGPNLGQLHLTSAKAFLHQCGCQGDCDLENPCFESAYDEGQMIETLKIARCSLGCLAMIEGDPPFTCP